MVWSCVLIRYKTTTPPPPRQRIFDMARLLFERFHERGKLAQNLDCERPFRGRFAQAGPGSRQSDRAQCPSLADVQEPWRTLALKQNAQPLAVQRVKWMRDNQRTQR